MSDDRLAEIKALLADAGPGKWSRQDALSADAVDWLVAEVERLRAVIEGAALTMQELGQPVVRDNLLGAIGDLKSRIGRNADPNRA